MIHPTYAKAARLFEELVAELRALDGSIIAGSPGYLDRGYHLGEAFKGTVEAREHLLCVADCAARAAGMGGEHIP